MHPLQHFGDPASHQRERFVIMDLEVFRPDGMPGPLEVPDLALGTSRTKRHRKGEEENQPWSPPQHVVIFPPRSMGTVSSYKLPTPYA